MTSQPLAANDLVERTQSLYQAFGQGDVAAILGLVGDDVEWGYAVDYTRVAKAGPVPAPLGPFKGKAGVKAYFAAVSEHLDVQKLAPLGFLAAPAGPGAPGRVAALIDKHIVVKKTGRSYSGLLIHLFEFGPDGLIRRHVHFDDTAAVLAAYEPGVEGGLSARVRAIYEAFGRGDVPAIMATVHDDVDWASEPDSKIAPWHGRRRKAEVPGFFAALGESLEVTEFAVQSMAENATEVFALIRFGIVVKATGKRGAMDLHHFWRFKDGKVILYRGTEDTALTAQLLSR